VVDTHGLPVPQPHPEQLDAATVAFEPVAIGPGDGCRAWRAPPTALYLLGRFVFPLAQQPLDVLPKALLEFLGCRVARIAPGQRAIRRFEAFEELAHELVLPALLLELPVIHVQPRLFGTPVQQYGLARSLCILVLPFRPGNIRVAVRFLIGYRKRRTHPMIVGSPYDNSPGGHPAACSSAVPRAASRSCWPKAFPSEEATFPATLPAMLMANPSIT
jgi:hypothetical protein